MTEEQFNVVIDELLEKLAEYAVGSEKYVEASEELLKWQKSYQEYIDSMLERKRIESEEKTSREKNKTADKEIKFKLIIGLMNVFAILGLGAFCTIWSAEMPITNKIATTFMSFFKPKF